MKRFKAKTRAKSNSKKPAQRRKKTAKLPRNSRVTDAAIPLLAKLDALDKKLLQLTQGPYAKILKGFEAGRKLVDEERRLALMMSERILKKARQVRRSLKI